MKNRITLTWEFYSPSILRGVYTVLHSTGFTREAYYLTLDDSSSNLLVP